MASIGAWAGTSGRASTGNARESAGFTMIEVLVAVAIFALVGMASAQMLRGLLSAEASVDNRTERLFALQRAVQMLDRDFRQIVDRPIRDGAGDPLSALYTDRDTDSTIEFTRMGWANPLGDPRGNLQRVRWVLRDQRLERHYWEHLDRVDEIKPARQLVLEQVGAFELEFIDASGDLQRQWPPLVVRSTDPSAAAQSQQGPGATGFDPPSEPDLSGLHLPWAVRVTLTLAPWGRVERLYALAAPVSVTQDRPPPDQPDGAPDAANEGAASQSAADRVRRARQRNLPRTRPR